MDPEFPESPSKRRRTMSPDESASHPESLPQVLDPMPKAVYEPPLPDPSVKEEIERKVAAENNFLDVLMQQVEAQADGAYDASTTSTEALPASLPSKPDVAPQHASADVTMQQAEEISESALKSAESAPESAVTAPPLSETAEKNMSDQVTASDEQPTATSQSQPTADEGASQNTAQIEESTVADPAANIASTESTQQTSTALAQDANTQALQEREWETDSSPYSSDTSSSDDSSSDENSDEDADGDYAMLDPEEAARILMQDDGGSDDEGKTKETGRAGLRTAHEQVEEVIPKPNITMTEDTQIVELGTVEFVVENTILIRGKTSGEYQVLESGSALCLKDRTIIGAVAETIGRVEEPMYTVRFTNEDAIKEAGVSDKGTAVYYVLDHSTFVFTAPLKSYKGSDASNFHDEEVGAEEMEFSDDEKEAEHKRQLKQKRKGRQDDGGRGGRGRGRGSYQNSGRLPSVPETNGNVATLDYDDGGEGYTPLTRPSNLHESFSGVEPEPGELPEQHHSPQQNSRGGFQNNRGQRGRGRGGSNRGGRGGGSRGRGGGYAHQPYQQPHQYQQQQQPPFPFPNGQYPSFPGQTPPRPQLIPQGSAPGPYGMPMSPSPITPLFSGPSNGAFNFPGQQFPQFGGMPPPPPPPGGFNFGQTGQQQLNLPGVAQMQELMNRFQQQQQQQQQRQG